MGHGCHARRSLSSLSLGMFALAAIHVTLAAEPAKPGAAAAEEAAVPAAKVRLGVDQLIADDLKPLKGKRVGLITNPTGLTSDLRATIDVLFAAKGIKLVALFGPEHGLRGETPAGDDVDDSKDSVTGLPVYSLYGKTRRPTPEMLQGLDVLVYDVQDIGARSYTFISTLAIAMEVAAEHKLGFVVLDRPNPLGGERIEGRPLDLKFKSFVGHLPIPYLHGMTVGEVAEMINGEGWLPDGAKCDLTVIKMTGWKRSMEFAETGLVWVPTSPHIPRADTSLYYATTGIMGELKVISEGVGYTLPFEVAGMPEFDPQKLADNLNARHLAGVFFRPVYFKPYYGRYEKKTCGGVHVLLTDHARVELTPIQFHIMDAVRQLYPDTKMFDGDRDKMFDKVCGTDEIRKLFEAGRPIKDILAAWSKGVEEFRAQRAKYLLYP